MVDNKVTTVFTPILLGNLSLIRMWYKAVR